MLKYSIVTIKGDKSDLGGKSVNNLENITHSEV